jgi:hypothetical protein
MAASLEDIEGYLQKLERQFERLEDQTLLVVIAAGQPALALRVAEPVVVMQVDITSAPQGHGETSARLFRRLLELNATSLLHAAYGLEDGAVVLCAALDLASLGFGELEAVLGDIDMALAEHVPELRRMVDQKAQA